VGGPAQCSAPGEPGAGRPSWWSGERFGLAFAAVRVHKAGTHAVWRVERTDSFFRRIAIGSAGAFWALGIPVRALGAVRIRRRRLIYAVVSYEKTYAAPGTGARESLI